MIIKPLIQVRQYLKKSFDWIAFNRHFLGFASMCRSESVRRVWKIRTRLQIGIWGCCRARQLLSICRTVVIDAYFSKESFVTGAISLGFNIISRFRDDVNLKYIYWGPRTGRKGRPRKFVSKVELDITAFHEEISTVGNQTYRLYTADVWAVNLRREAELSLWTTSIQTRKVFFSTDLTMSAGDIFSIYRTRFQLEFVYRDSKQLMGLAHCQARNNEAISLAFNASWSISPGLMHARKGTVFPSSPLKPYCTMLLMPDKFNSMSAKHTNRRLNNTDFKELLFYGVRNAG